MPLVRNLPLVAVLLLAMAGCSSHGGFTEEAMQNANVGDAALSAGNADVALRLADETLTRNPGDADALIRRGLALTALGRLDDARESLRKAVASEPRNVRALLALGRVQLPVDPEAAEASFQAVLHQEGRNAAALNDLGIARDLQGHHEDAEAAYRSAIAASPEMTAAKVNLALCLAMAGQADAAIGLLRPLADGPSATQKIKEDYAAVLVMAGNRQEAEHVLAGNMSPNELAPALDVLALARAPGGRVTQ